MQVSHGLLRREVEMNAANKSEVCCDYLLRRCSSCLDRLPQTVLLASATCTKHMQGNISK